MWSQSTLPLIIINLRLLICAELYSSYTLSQIMHYVVKWPYYIMMIRGKLSLKRNWCNIASFSARFYIRLCIKRNYLFKKAK